MTILLAKSPVASVSRHALLTRGGVAVTKNKCSPNTHLTKRSFFNYSRQQKQSNTRSSSTFAFNSANRDPGLAFTGVISDPKEVPGPTDDIPSRHEQLRRLQDPEQVYDLLVIGGGATGAGIALDAASRQLADNGIKTRLKVACIERGDFASETSSRSTKLIWAGIKYMGTAAASLLSVKLFTNPIDTVHDFVGEMKMVWHCHQERHYMLTTQRHLTYWVPIVVPFYKWHLSPPPLDHWLFGFFPVLAPLTFKIYDALSYFKCPPSYIMTKNKAKQAFPQLLDENLKYCSVFYEAMHNDARTNIAIAMSAAKEGADICNYVEMVDTIRGEDASNPDRVTGIVALDRMTGRTWKIRAKKVVLAGGPFTDNLRRLEEGHDSADNTSGTKKPHQAAVRGASGTHIIIPGYFLPKQTMGLLDYRTSDGRFMFILPWLGHTLIGTTDKKSSASTMQDPPEDEIQWLLKECTKYLCKDFKVRRSDVLSAWRGWRPLAVDPHAPPDAPVSRDHVISDNPHSGVTFIAGGKWTTWREMAQEVVDRVLVQGKGSDISKSILPLTLQNVPICRTLDIVLHGGDGYHDNIAIQLIQKYSLDQTVAEHLAKTYGARAWDVCRFLKPSGVAWPKFGKVIVEGFPYLDAEVVYACREYAVTIEDVLSRRTRLAYLNKDAALAAIPKVADIMQKELSWTEAVKEAQIEAATKYIKSYSGSRPEDFSKRLQEKQNWTPAEIFASFDLDENEFLDRVEMTEICQRLGVNLSDKELQRVFDEMDHDGRGQVSLRDFEEWWRTHRNSKFRQQIGSKLQVQPTIKKVDDEAA